METQTKSYLYDIRDPNLEVKCGHKIKLCVAAMDSQEVTQWIMMMKMIQSKEM